MANTYESYKDSGIAWIGKIPSGWSLVDAKRVLKSEKTIAGSAADNYERLALTLNGVIKRSKDDSEGLQPEKFESYQVLGKNELVFKLIDLQNISTSRVGLSPFEGLVSPAYIVVKNRRREDNRYYYYWYMNMYYTHVFNNLGGDGVRSAINAQDLLSMKVPYISIDEQKAIATFLDKKCSEIDSFISLQEEMISELQSYKQSVITETVTKGLDPKAKMRYSGVEWIGDMPESWNAQKLRTLGWTQNGISQSGDYFGEEFPYPFISYSDAYKNFAVPYPSGRANSTDEDRKRFSLIEGDVLFTRTSETIEEIGFASTCMESIPDVVYSGFLIRFRPTSDKLYKGYSKYYFRSQIHRAYFVKEMNLVTRASLSQDLLKNLVVLLPSFGEQKAIADFLDEKTEQIETIIAIKQQKIQELKDYKKSIIYEYVTGKKKVD